MHISRFVPVLLQISPVSLRVSRAMLVSLKRESPYDGSVALISGAAARMTCRPMSKSAHTHQNAREPTMNKPSERIVVFVTPAQKRAISATADGLGISISELMRRAVLAFGATSDPVRVASIVDRLNAPRQPDALAQVLQKAARPLRASRTGAIWPQAARMEAIGAAAQKEGALADSDVTAAIHDEAGTREETPPACAAPLPAVHTDQSDVSQAAREIAQAVARLSAEAEAAAKSAALDDAAAQPHEDAPLQPLSSAPFARSWRSAGAPLEDARSDDAAPEGGKFA